MQPPTTSVATSRGQRVRLPALLVALLLQLGIVLPALAAEGPSPTSDAESCLSCHRFPGLSRLDDQTGELRLFFCSERYFAERQGPHARLECTDCHERSEVEVIPHQETSPVDCTQSCHVVSSAGVPVSFSHEQVARRLERSVHNQQALQDLSFVHPPLRSGQSTCLYCHDQPKYRTVDQVGVTHRGLDPETRCESCHDESLPVDVAYYLQHTAGRLQSARPPMDLAEVCATCHSDPALMEQMGQHDAVTSYFNSFHGKAALLGNGDTATCLHCHQCETGDVHVMLAASEPMARTNPDHLETTCRSVQCHPNAVPELSGAAVHMRIDPRTPTPEYAVVAALALLTIVVMSMYFTQIMLELLNVLLRGDHAEHRELRALAKMIMAHPEGRKRIERQTTNQRIQHWFLAVSFITLVITGMPLKFAAEPWAQTLMALLGGLTQARAIHRFMAVIQLGTFVYHVGYLGWHMILDQRRRAVDYADRPLWRRVFDMVWEFPMMVRPKDVVQYFQLFLYLFGLRKHRPAQDKYHFSQKFEYWAVFWGMNIIGLSGIALWAHGSVPGLVGGRLLNFALVAHSYEAFLAALHVAVVHMFAVALSPAVFPLHLGSLTGTMPADEMAEGHAAHLRQVARELGIEVDVPAPDCGPWPLLCKVVRKSYSLGLFAVMCVAAFFSMNLLFSMLQGLDTVVDVDELPLRLDESDLTASAAGLAGGASEDVYRRGPMAHYHAIPAWLTPDTGNDCTSSGCHPVLPHGERKEDRAFLNMHSTFVDCQVCHLHGERGEDSLAWLSLQQREQRDPPAVMRLAGALEPDVPRDLPALQALDATLRELLAEAIADIGGDAELERWLKQLETSRIGGPQHALFVEQMRQGIFLHGHGEYGAKLGLPGHRWSLDAEQQVAAEALRADAGALSDDERQQLQDKVHQDLDRPNVGCTRCHAEQPEWVDYEALGYSPARAEALRSNNVVRQSQAVERGETFFLPDLLQTPEQQPATDDEGLVPLDDEGLVPLDAMEGSP